MLYCSSSIMPFLVVIHGGYVNKECDYITTSIIYKNKWQARFVPWAIVCNSCSKGFRDLVQGLTTDLAEIVSELCCDQKLFLQNLLLYPSFHMVQTTLSTNLSALYFCPSFYSLNAFYPNQSLSHLIPCRYLLY